VNNPACIVRPFVRIEQFQFAEFGGSPMALTASELQIYQQGVQFGWQMATQQQLTGAGTLAHAGTLPGMTQVRRRGRPRKATTGTASSATRSHKRKAT
jgi:hypothetical protein